MNSLVTVPGVIQKKKFGKELNECEIKTFISGLNSTTTDSQIGAFLMAVRLNGMTAKETACLTKAMVNSGNTFTWPKEWKGLLVDKHSTGGVGDKISLPLAPALAANGLKVPMISGRGLSITGGTLDKLESIPGYQTQLPVEKIREIMEKTGCVIVGQTKNICPADKKLYAIRDVTATIDSYPLIVGSILSKKLAENIDALVMEITYGKCCFMETIDDARALAKHMIENGEKSGLKTSAMLVHMHNPLGNMVGNALEIKESIECLYGKADKDLTEAVCKMGGQLLVHAKKVDNLEKGMAMIEKSLQDGTARAKFHEMIVGQGVAKDVADKLVSEDYSCLPQAKLTTSLKARKTGIIHGIDAWACGTLVHQIGGGRTKEGDAIKFGVGLELTAKIGDSVNEGDEWAIIHHDDELETKYIELLDNALTIEKGDPEAIPRISEIIS